MRSYFRPGIKGRKLLVDKLQVNLKLFWKKLIENLNCREGMDLHFRTTVRGVRH